jgi:hypothetical protein
MGINSNTYNTFSDDIAAHKVAIQIERNLMGLKPNRKKRKVKGSSSFEGQPLASVSKGMANPTKSSPIDKTFKKEEDKRDKTIESLQNELEKLKSQNTRAVESSHRNTGSFWKRNKKDIMDAVIVLGILYIGYKMFFDKKEVSQNAMGGEVAGAEMGGEVEI